MNILKRIAIILAFFLILGVVISLFLPSSFHMERSVVVNADREQVFKQVNDLKNWKNWSSWALKDPSIYLDGNSFSSPSYGDGATFSWVSDNDEVGSGTIKIVISTKDEYIENNMSFKMRDAVGTWNFKDVDGGVEVVWGADVEFGFNPIAKFFGLFLEDKIAPDYELGLERLKVFTENLPKIKKVVVKDEMMSDNLYYLSIRDTVHQKEMNNIHGKNYAIITQFMAEKGVEINGSPLVIYHSWSDTLVDIEVGMPVADSLLLGSGDIKINYIKATRVVTAIHYGGYDRLPETYFGINEWMRKNRVIVTGPPWEVYITDPTMEPNPENWETAIYFPIE